MRESILSFAQVNDIFGLASSSARCLSAASHWRVAPDPWPVLGDTDYIAIPTSELPVAAHDAGEPVVHGGRFQIRTELMNAVAGEGIAAHWMYKTKRAAGRRRGAAPECVVAAVARSTSSRRPTTPANSSEHVEDRPLPRTRSTSSRPSPKILAAAAGARAGGLRVRDPTPTSATIASRPWVNGERRSRCTELRSGDVVEVAQRPGALAQLAWLNFVHAAAFACASATTQQIDGAGGVAPASARRCSAQRLLRRRRPGAAVRRPAVTPDAAAISAAACALEAATARARPALTDHRPRRKSSRPSSPSASARLMAENAACAPTAVTLTMAAMAAVTARAGASPSTAARAARSAWRAVPLADPGRRDRRLPRRGGRTLSCTAEVRFGRRLYLMRTA